MAIHPLREDADEALGKLVAMLLEQDRHVFVNGARDIAARLLDVERLATARDPLAHELDEIRRQHLIGLAQGGSDDVTANTLQREEEKAGVVVAR